VLLISILANFVISLCTKPRGDAELKNLVYGLTPLPSQERVRIWHRPIFWAVVVAVLLIAVNILFW
jgi:SSS family solute:Na+ symporter